MLVLLGGTGQFGFSLSRPRVYEGGLAEIVGDVPPGAHELRCLAAIILADDDPYDLGFSVAAAVLRRSGPSVVGGYFTKGQARQFRQEVAALGISVTDSMVCRARIVGGAPFGRFTTPDRLMLDLGWPIALGEVDASLSGYLV